ncbi:hypothetical protein J8C02_11785 [Chloracidobacterium sp. MS 40/45]|uniref:hypothetical protein n=1 Tax=Chloracidobacterium aggregatum TaxID=2851959 RepID=UPI001B8CE7BC|nr:hypothetical protein [Chloracidobacterium aggregatum]QUW01567.1 hypothetical protein J8C02_11785 [Chloracidobacterium sp. MS 40/45]
MPTYWVGIGLLFPTLLETTGQTWGHMAAAMPLAPKAQTPSEHMQDMKTRQQIDREERSLRDLREAGRALETLTRRMAKRFDAVPKATRPQLSKQDTEDLKQIEKLAKRVRDLQGARGEGEDATPLPGDFSEQVALLAHLGTEIRQQSEQISRHTVSVGILARTARILRLLRVMRATDL